MTKHRGEHMRAGFALQLVTVRWLGTFLEDVRRSPSGGIAGVDIPFAPGLVGRFMR